MRHGDLQQSSSRHVLYSCTEQRVAREADDVQAAPAALVHRRERRQRNRKVRLADRQDERGAEGRRQLRRNGRAGPAGHSEPPARHSLPGRRGRRRLEGCAGVAGVPGERGGVEGWRRVEGVVPRQDGGHPGHLVAHAARLARHVLRGHLSVRHGQHPVAAQQLLGRGGKGAPRSGASDSCWEALLPPDRKEALHAGQTMALAPFAAWSAVVPGCRVLLLHLPAQLLVGAWGPPRMHEENHECEEDDGKHQNGHRHYDG
mmetsp:Transcript_18088/g.56661  ORF Transcript_18088/g.56661 Transcript_18088/m.56661 type:complete len:259 (-) Transcript_18088:455-1231(-)